MRVRMNECMHERTHACMNARSLYRNLSAGVKPERVLRAESIARVHLCMPWQGTVPLDLPRHALHSTQPGLHSSAAATAAGAAASLDELLLLLLAARLRLPAAFFLVGFFGFAPKFSTRAVSFIYRRAVNTQTHT